MMSKIKPIQEKQRRNEPAKQSKDVQSNSGVSIWSFAQKFLPLPLLLIVFLNLLTTLVGARVLLTDIVTIFCIQSVSLTNSASKPSYRFAIKKAQNTFSSVA